MNTENSITNQKGYDDSLTENSTKHAANADSSYDGLSQDEVRRLKEMAPELRDALLRLRRNRLTHSVRCQGCSHSKTGSIQHVIRIASELLRHLPHTG